MGASTPFPTPAAIARAELFTRERFVYEGETLEDALSTGAARRRALDAALAEIDAGAKQPSIEWRRKFSLLLGLERLLSEDEPHLADDTVLSAHQVDALSGTLTALLAEAQRNGNGSTAAAASPGPDAADADPAREERDPDPVDPDAEPRARGSQPAEPEPEDRESDPTLDADADADADDLDAEHEHPGRHRDRHDDDARHRHDDDARHRHDDHAAR
jgi:ribonuclease E